MASFTARYESECSACDTVIQPGDVAGYVEDEVCCQACYLDAQPAASTEVVPTRESWPEEPPYEDTPWDDCVPAEPPDLAKLDDPSNASTMDMAVNRAVTGKMLDAIADPNTVHRFPAVTNLPLPEIKGPLDSDGLEPAKGVKRAATSCEEAHWRWVLELMQGYESRWSGRSAQQAIGPSELGGDCDRKIAYKIAGVPRANWKHTPAWAPLVGTSLHSQFAEMLNWANESQPGRYLVEFTVEIVDGEIVGHLDVYDRQTQTLTDWKFPGMSTITRMRKEGMGQTYLVQGQVYAYGLARQGETPKRVGIVAIGRDARNVEAGRYVELHDYDPTLAREALERYEGVKNLVSTGLSPLFVRPTSSGLCDYCPYFAPGVTNMCDGKDWPSAAS